MMQKAYGELKLKPWEFDEYEMCEFMWALQGLKNAKLDQWQHTRSLAYTTAKPHLKNKKMSLEQFWPLPGDKESPSLVRKMKDMSRDEKKKAWQNMREQLQKDGLINPN